MKSWKNTKQEKVLGVTLDKLNFATHLVNIIKMAISNLMHLREFKKYMTTDQKS